MHAGAVEAAGHEVLLGEFLERACIFSGPLLDFPHKWARAERIRVHHPDIAKSGIHAAVVCGDLEEVRRRLESDPGSINAKGGPQKWEPLLFACYGRLPYPPAAEHSVDIVKLLLDAGADPNTHFVFGDEWKIRFNALTGVMGKGEMSQPEHPRADAIARLLLERGANPNDSQGLYDTHLQYVGDETKWLDLLFSYGLSKDDLINWDAEPKEGKAPAPVLSFLLSGAAKNGHTKRLACLLSHGADPNARSTYDGKSCYASALVAGNVEAAEILAAHGAVRDPLDGYDAFVSACMRGARDEATRLLAGHSEYLQSVDPLIDASTRGNAEVVALLLDLGLSPNGVGRHGHRALNVACTNAKIAQLLLDHGADPRARCYGGTPAHWALGDGSLVMARFFASKSRYILDAVSSGHVALVKELLAENPELTKERSPMGNTPLHVLPRDPDEAQELIDVLLARGADPQAKNDAGQTPAQKLETDALDPVADLLEAAVDRARARE